MAAHWRDAATVQGGRGENPSGNSPREFRTCKDSTEVILGRFEFSGELPRCKERFFIGRRGIPYGHGLGAGIILVVLAGVALAGSPMLR